MHADIGNGAREDEEFSYGCVQKWPEIAANRQVCSSDFGELRRGYNCIAVPAFGFLKST